MKTNHDILIDSILEQDGPKYGTLTKDQLFCRWTFEQILKKRALSYADLQQGDVDGSNDGGIDGWFLFADQSVIVEPPETDLIRRGVLLELVIIQAKNQRTFKENAFDKLISSLDELLALGKPGKNLKPMYSSRLLENRELFRTTYLSLASKHPSISIRIVYASRGTTNKIHPKVKYKAETLEKKLRSHFSRGKSRVDLFGA